MTTVTLTPDLAQQIEEITGKGSEETTRFIEHAVRTYLMQIQRNKIREETKAFNEQLDKILDEYQGQYVAIHEGEVIDHDFNLRTLHLRIFEKLGHTPVLLKQVKVKSDQELIFRSPRLENIES